MEITEGIVHRAQRAVIYGIEGVGKSTIASKFPNPLFIDLESGTDHLPVSRAPKPESFSMLGALILDLTKDIMGYKTVVIDTIGAAERLAIESVCFELQVPALGGQGDYGRTYNKLEEKWAKLLDVLTVLSKTTGAHVVLLAHAQTKKFELPEEAGAFDKWEINLEKKTNALTKKWSDMLLFAAYNTLVEDGKAQGQERVLRTTHHAAWDAKNRHSLPDVLPLDYKSIGHIFDASDDQAVSAVKMSTDAIEAGPTTNAGPWKYTATYTPLPKALIQLMEKDCVSESMIRKAVAKRGHYTEATPITNYTPDFINGMLVEKWNDVLAIIREAKKEES